MSRADASCACGYPAAGLQSLYLAPRAAQGNRAADGIGARGVDDAVEIGGERMARIVGAAGRPLDPPAVLAEHGAGGEPGTSLGAGDRLPARGPDAHPVALADPACGGIRRRDLQRRIGQRGGAARRCCDAGCGNRRPSWRRRAAAGSRPGQRSRRPRPAPAPAHSHAAAGAPSRSRRAWSAWGSRARRHPASATRAHRAQPTRRPPRLRARGAARPPTGRPGPEPRHVPDRRSQPNIFSPSPSRSARPSTMSVSPRASPRGAITAGRSCTRRSPSRLPSKPVRRPSRSHEVAAGSTMSA